MFQRQQQQQRARVQAHNKGHYHNDHITPPTTDIAIVPIIRLLVYASIPVVRYSISFAAI